MYSLLRNCFATLVTAAVLACATWVYVAPQQVVDWRTAPFIDHTISATGPIRGLHGKSRAIERSFKSDPEANAVFDRVLKAAGRPELMDRIIFRASAETSNAMASNKEGVGPIVIYDPVFMQDLLSKTGNNYWSMIAVVAHEVGHHILLHPATLGRDHEFELEADRLAGKILANMCASWMDTKAAYEQFSEAASETHPARSQRIAVLALGWREGKCATGKKEPAPRTDTTEQIDSAAKARKKLSETGSGPKPPPVPRQPLSSHDEMFGEDAAP